MPSLRGRSLNFSPFFWQCYLESYGCCIFDGFILLLFYINKGIFLLIWKACLFKLYLYFLLISVEVFNGITRIHCLFLASFQHLGGDHENPGWDLPICYALRRNILRGSVGSEESLCSEWETPKLTGNQEFLTANNKQRFLRPEQIISDL